MSYLSYWRLSRSPFSLRSPEMDYFVSGSVAEALARAEFLVQHGRRLGILFGPRGVGKSSFFRYFAGRCSHFPKQIVGLVDFAGATPTLLAKRFRDAILGEFATERWPSTSRSAEAHSLGRIIQEIDEIILANNALGRRPLLLLDNAEEADEEILQTLGILLKRQGSWSAILTVDASLLVEMPRKILEECEMRIDLPAWDLGLTAEYFDYSLAKSGNNEDIFTGQGITRLHELGEGIPKRMFQLADMTLVAGAAKSLAPIDADLVEQVANEFSFGYFPGEYAAFEQVPA